MTEKTLNEMAAEVRAINTEKGWRVVKSPWGDYVALLHSEITEMLEAYRDHRLADATGPVLVSCPDPQCGDSTWDHDCLEGVTRPGKPEGVGSEAADVLIRLLDMADVYGLRIYDMDCGPADIDPVYPASGAPSTFGGWCAWLHTRAAKLYEVTGDEPLNVRWELGMMLRALVAFTSRWGIDLYAEYERKIAFNRTRPYQHGGRTLSDAERTAAR